MIPLGVMSFAGLISTPIGPFTQFLAKGDSWSAPGNNYELDRFAAAYPTATIVNTSVAGQGWDDWQASLSSDLASYPNTQMIIVNGVINTLAGSSTAAQTLAKAQAYCDAARAIKPTIKIAIADAPPSTVSGYNAKRATYNASLRAALGTWYDVLIPRGSYLADADASDTTLYDNSQMPGHPHIPLQIIDATIIGAALGPVISGATATSPSAFTFTAKINAEYDTDYVAFTDAPLTGMKPGQAASASSAKAFAIGRGGTASTSAKQVVNGDWPAITVHSSASASTAVTGTLAVGGTTADYVVTSKAASEYATADDYSRAGPSLGSTSTGSNPYVGTATISGGHVAFGASAGQYFGVDPGFMDGDMLLDVNIPADQSTGRPILFVFGYKTGTANTKSDFSRSYEIDLFRGETIYNFNGNPLHRDYFTPFAAGVRTVRVVYKASANNFAVYDATNPASQVLLVTSPYPAGDDNWIPKGTYVGLYDTGSNAAITADNLKVKAAT